MKKIIKVTIALLIITSSVLPDTNAQAKLSKSEFSINAFRNPSIGAEYRYRSVSLHAGFYTTAFESGVYTNFVKSGLTYWFMTVGKKNNPSSFYTSLSYARGLTRDYSKKNATIGEVGFRWIAWRGLNVRIGVAALASKGERIQINPTPGISYSFFFN